MMVAIGFGIIFVQSKRPPRPVSRIQISAGVSAKALNASAVVYSKKVTELPLLTE